MSLEDFPRLDIGFLPTPLHKLENISREIGVDVYIKRDDLTGFAFGGNKIRKLEYVLADARKKKADTILTCGALQSNHCRLTAGVAAKLGFDVHLVLSGKKKPKEFTGNLLLDKLFDAKTHYMKLEGFKAEQLQQEMERVADKLEEEGKNTYPIPAGGSNPLGSLGYVRAAREIKNSKVNFSHIFHATSSGGTQAGLQMGKKVFDLDSQIIGIAVWKSQGKIRNKVSEICRGIGDLLGVEQPEKGEITVNRNFVGEGYGIKTEEGKEAVKLMASKEGILLDHVYTGKALAGLIDHARKGKISGNILFLHTGGNVELFA